MELKGAIATHVGNVRENNQDRAHFAGYVAVVADGMGGHQGGEMAASIAISEFTDIYDPIGPGGLVELVEEANRAVFEKAADPELRGMGTTLVAMTLRPGEEKVSVVNVGDSRAYYLNEDELEQITLDHSLVEDLVRQNRLSPEEALTHPQRNILTRALGIASDVEVDKFLRSTKVGDRFLLCSDGLFNEVTEEEIARILAVTEEPNEAADALVAAALQGPGRDNITVAVVDVVEDGAGGNVSSEAAETLLVPAVSRRSTTDPEGVEPLENDEPPAGGTAGDRTPPARSNERRGGRGGVDVVEPEALVGTDSGAIEDLGTDRHGSLAPTVDTAEYDLDLAPARSRAVVDGAPDADHLPDHDGEERQSPTLGQGSDLEAAPVRRTIVPRLVGVIGLVALAALAYVGIGWYAERTWFLADDESGQVALFRGRPGGLLWADPVLEEVTTTALTDMSPDAQQEIRAGRTFPTRADAETYLVEEMSMPPEAVDLLGQVDEKPPAADATADATADGAATAGVIANEAGDNVDTTGDADSTDQGATTGGQGSLATSTDDAGS
ncbi:MAG: Stp1/IreP family PP2C-type Ser/Thr phosphatase [Acidimicrobiales bacterium]